MMLIRTYRVRGHLAANLDPLGLVPARAAGRPHARISRLHRRRPRPADLARRRARLRTGDGARDRRRSCAPITAAMSASNICTSTMSRSAASSRSGWRARTRSSSRPRARRRSSTKVIQAEQWEKFLARKYVGTKRFGLDGGEAMIPALEAVIKYGGQIGVREIVCRHGPPRPAQRARQRHGQALPRDLPRIRRRLAPIPRMSAARATSNITSAPRTDREFDGIKVHLSLVAQPVAPRSGRSGRARQGRAPADRLRRRQARRHGAAGAAPRRRRLRRPGHRLGMLRLLRPARLQHRRHASISSSTTRSASPPARNSRAPRLIRRTSPRASRRRSSTSTATIPKR